MACSKSPCLSCTIVVFSRLASSEPDENSLIFGPQIRTCNKLPHLQLPVSTLLFPVHPSVLISQVPPIVKVNTCVSYRPTMRNRHHLLQTSSSAPLNKILPWTCKISVIILRSFFAVCVSKISLNLSMRLYLKRAASKIFLLEQDLYDQSYTLLKGQYGVLLAHNTISIH